MQLLFLRGLGLSVLQSVALLLEPILIINLACYHLQKSTMWLGELHDANFNCSALVN